MDAKFHGIRPGLLNLLRGSSSLRNTLAFCLYEVAFYFAYRFAMSFSQTSASPCWFPESILLCGLLLSSPRKWWFLLLGTLPIRLLVAVPPDVPFWFLLVCFLIDSFKAILVAAALRLCIPNPVRFATVGQYALFCLFAVILGPSLSALSGAAALHALNYDYWAEWLQWFLGDATTQLIITPAIFYGVLGDSWATW